MHNFLQRIRKNIIKIIRVHFKKIDRENHRCFGDASSTNNRVRSCWLLIMYVKFQSNRLTSTEVIV